MRSLATALCVLAGLTATPVLAETVQYTATMSAQSEVPPHPDLKGMGTVSASFDTAAKKLTYTATYQDLTGPAVAAHFHGPAAAGTNAGVLIPVNGALTSPINGSAVLTDEQVKALEGGMLYFNVHTAANKGGEIRGQVEKAK